MKTSEIELSKSAIRFTQVASAAFFIMMLYVNLSDVSANVAVVSNRYANLITPAPVTFAIWGLIYVGLSAYVIWQFRSLFSGSISYETDHAVYKIGLLFILSCIFNALWIFAWTSGKLLISLILLIGLLFSLIEINQRIYRLLPNSPSYRIFLRVPFGFYLGWISIAVIANAAAYLVKIGWTGFGLNERAWTVAIITAAFFIALWNVRRMNNISYGLATIWGFLGILLARSGDANGLTNTIGVTLIASIFLITIATLSRLPRWA